MLSRQRLAQHRLRRLMQKPDYRPDMAAAHFVDHQHAARTHVGIVERFRQRIDRCVTDIERREKTHPFSEATLKKCRAQKVDDRLLMGSWAARTERREIRSA